MNKTKLTSSYHAKQRAYERLFEHNVQMGATHLGYMEELLQEIVKPAEFIQVAGSKYTAQIEGFPNHRAKIVVTEPFLHTVITILPII